MECTQQAGSARHHTMQWIEEKMYKIYILKHVCNETNKRNKRFQLKTRAKGFLYILFFFHAESFGELLFICFHKKKLRKHYARSA